MLMIISSRFDHSTCLVIEWLVQKKVPFKRWNGEDACTSATIQMSENGALNIELENNCSGNFSFGEFTKYWYRRGEFQTFRPVMKNLKKQVAKILNQEWDRISGFLYLFIQEKPHLGEITIEKNHSKLMSLIWAARCGLMLPNTLITTEKEEILKHRAAFPVQITKAIFNLFSISSKNGMGTVGTEVIELGHLDQLNSKFFPTLIQENIDKAFELRIFFLKHDFYPMAIFSQSDKQTEVDFRNYNTERPNRCVPFVLPPDIKCKLIRYVDTMNLDTGSIDLIVTKNGEYVFLEVNHIGQFGWLSSNCNYYIEEKIAEYLLKL